jgi:hypothetical protein
MPLRPTSIKPLVSSLPKNLHQSIPLVKSNGVFVSAEMTVQSIAEQYGTRVRFMLNGRGNAKMAVFTHAEASKAGPTLSSRGMAYEQELSTGRVWALRGIVGSGRRA